MRTFIGFLLCFVMLNLGAPSAKAQTIELLAGNTLNGAVNGSLLGGAVMALNNDTDFGPLRVGLGLGTLYGIGVGAYDVATSGGQQLMVSGTFNDGNNTSILVLLDTFYGAAGGAVIASSVMLIANKPLVDGLKYGAATGAWVGFGVGLIDAFMLSKRITPTTASLKTKSQTADGLVALRFDKASVGLIHPSIITTYSSKGAEMSRDFTPTVNLLNVRLNF
jgi:hypothetical protein